MTDFKKGRYLAATIPGARFVALESDNHIVLGDERRLAGLRPRGRGVPGRRPHDAGHRPARPTRCPRASARCSTLAATGLGNDEIAADLHLSVRTVERHFHNIYAKLGVSGRSARTAAVSQLLAAR